MAELKDYSGDFLPNAKFQDFSKDALAALLTEYARLSLALDAWWQAVVREKYGEKIAIELELAVWAKGVPYQQQRVMEALNIKGNDVATCFKELQMDPQFRPPMFDITWDYKNKNHGIFTVNRCKAVDYFEKIGDTKTMLAMCDLDLKAFEKIAKFINPNIKVKFLKMPPRKDQNDIACRFEFKLEPTA
jgi:hypothetical protein